MQLMSAQRVQRLGGEKLSLPCLKMVTAEGITLATKKQQSTTVMHALTSQHSRGIASGPFNLGTICMKHILDKPQSSTLQGGSVGAEDLARFCIFNSTLIHQAAWQFWLIPLLKHHAAKVEHSRRLIAILSCLSDSLAAGATLRYGQERPH